MPIHLRRPAAALLLGLLLAGPALAQEAGDPAAGQKAFRICAACHNVGEGAKNKIGPALEGVVGRVAGGFPGFAYSPAMKKAGEGGLTWTPDQLAEYLADPKAKVPGNKMAFAGVKKQEDLDNLIAFLIQHSPDYVPAEGGAMAPAAPAQ